MNAEECVSVGVEFELEEYISAELDSHSMADSGSVYAPIKKNKKCFQMLEKLPLWSKLLIIGVITISGMLLFGILLLVLCIYVTQQASTGDYFVTLSEFSTDLPISLNYERLYAGLYVKTKQNRFLLNFISQTDLTNPMLVELESSSLGILKNTQNKILSDALVELLSLNTNLTSIKNSIINGQMDNIEIIFDTYFSYIDILNKVLLRFCVQSSNTRQCTLHNTILRYGNLFGYNIGVGNIILYQSVQNLIQINRTNNLSIMYTNSLAKESIFINMINDLAILTEIPYIEQSFNGQAAKQVKSFSNELGHNVLYSISPKIDVELYFNVTMLNMKQFYDLSTYLKQNIQSSMSFIKTISILLIVGVCAAVIIYFIITIMVTLCFSKSITGPWERINALLKNNISRFIPKNLLDILKVGDIVDLQYGNSIQKRLTIVVFKIKKYEQIVSKIGKKKGLEFTNRFFENIGPVLRNNKGFVDKYSLDGLVAIFRSDKDAEKATVEIINNCSIFNRENDSLPNLELAAAISTGMCFVSTVGDGGKMDILVSGETVEIAHRLIDISDEFSTKILSTKVPKDITSRLLGRIKKYDLSELDLCEILTNADHNKWNYYSMFNNGTKLLMSHQFKEASVIFQEIIKSNTADKTAGRMLHKCNQLILLDSLPINLEFEQILKNKIYYVEFKNFCQKEFSSENIMVYELIKEFHISVLADKKLIISKIYEKHISKSGENQLNINEGLKTDFEKLYMQNDLSSSIKSINLLQTEVELLLMDTFNRFKDSDSLKKAFVDKTILY